MAVTENSKLTLMSYIFHKFIESGLTTSGQKFSVNYLGMFKTYYDRMLLINVDFSINAAINCLINVRKNLKKLKQNSVTFGGIYDDKIKVLEEAEVKIRKYLRDKFKVAEIVEDNDEPEDDDDKFYGIVI